MTEGGITSSVFVQIETKHRSWPNQTPQGKF